MRDIGCGGGVPAEEFAVLGFRVTGVDTSEISRAAARNHASARRLSIDYRTGSGDLLSFGNESFDVVSCNDVPEHIHNRDAVIAEVARVIKPGGIFLRHHQQDPILLSALAVLPGCRPGPPLP